MLLLLSDFFFYLSFFNYTREISFSWVDPLKKTILLRGYHSKTRKSLTQFTLVAFSHIILSKIFSIFFHSLLFIFFHSFLFIFFFIHSVLFFLVMLFTLSLIYLCYFFSSIFPLLLIFFRSNLYLISWRFINIFSNSRSSFNYVLLSANGTSVRFFI